MNKGLTKLLKDYISKEKVEGAFYIDGSWGSGKTYFINNFMYEVNKDLNKPECFYVSLMGLTSVDEITKELFALCHPKINAIKNGNVAKCLLSVAKIGANTAGIDNDSIDDVVDAFASLFKNNQVKVLILDDFERSRIDLQELFGYISGFITINDIRVVLIGNDVEVRRYLQEDSIHRLRLLASNLSNNLDEYNKNIEQLEEPLLYDSIKEKCVYKTYLFTTDRNIMFDNLINEYPRTIQKIMRKYRTTLEWILNKYNCNNLRTFKVAVENYIFIVKNLHKRFNNDEYIKSRILLTCFVYTVLFKEGKENKEFNTKIFHVNERIYPVKTISDYVYKSSWNKEKMIEELSSIDEEINIEVSKDTPISYKKLNMYWYEKTDEQLKEEIHEAYKNLSLMPFSVYFQLFYYFHGYKEWFVNDKDIDLETIIMEMISLINKCENEIDYDEDYFLSERPEGYRPYYNRLKDAFDNHNADIRSKAVDIAHASLKSYTQEELDRFKSGALEYHSFFARIDVDELINTIKNATSSEIIDIRRFIKSVYHFNNLKDFFEGDLPNLLVFQEKLNELTFDSVIKSKNVEFMEYDLKDYISRLS